MFTKVERLISSRNLRPKKKEGFLKIISIFSFLGIMLGVAILIIVMSVMNGFKTELTNKILGLNPHIVIQPNGFIIDDKYISKIESTFEDISVSKTYSGEGIIMINDKAKGIIFKGVNNRDKKIKDFLKKNIVRPEIILNAATIIIKVSIINITFLSTLRALKKDLFKSDQV